jgi:hypothetical protein
MARILPPQNRDETAHVYIQEAHISFFGVGCAAGPSLWGVSCPEKNKPLVIIIILHDKKEIRV